MSSELTISEIDDLLGRSPTSIGDGFVGLGDPEGTERLGRALAERCASLEPTCLLVWERPHDLVLAHVAARALGVPAVRAFNLDGLVSFEGDFPPGRRTVLLADAFRAAEPVRAMCALAAQQGQQVVGAAALVDLQGPGTDELAQQQVSLSALTVRTAEETETSDG